MAKTFSFEMDHPHPKVDFSSSPSLTRQEFKDEANVNNLLKRYALTGAFYDPLTTQKAASRKPLFGDFTHFQDFQACQNAIIEAREAFDALPVEVRERFNYDPAKLISFLSDDANRDEAIKLGLIEKAAEAATPEPAKGGTPAAEPASEPSESAAGDGK